jgi:F-type H+-transporting ATPase subunit delta
MAPVKELHAASRAALSAAGSVLDAQLGDGTDAARIDVAAVGAELFAVVGLLDNQIGLRRTLADSSTEAAGREALVTGLLRGKVSDATLAVVGAVVGDRWSNPRELVDGIESLATTALLIGAERADRLDTVEDELFRLGRIVAVEGSLEQALSSRTAPKSAKVELLTTLLGGKVDPTTAALVENLVTAPRGRDVVGGLENLAAAAARRRERSVAHVISAGSLSAAQQERLSAILQRIYQRPIALHVEVDETLLGGLVIRVGDEVIDGSTIGRLDAARRTLAG